MFQRIIYGYLIIIEKHACSKYSEYCLVLRFLG